MAVTKIWDVKSHLRELIKYVEDTEKTSINISDDTISTLLEYGVDSLKTEQRLYVTPINCDLENAADIMTKLNKNSRSKSDTIAYHGYQSFARGEVDAKTAHEIGVKLAEELWGKDFPVIVATHINTGTYHNHFAFPATSFSGMRYNDCNTSYRKMREISDRICREYGLSVIEKPRNKSRHIGEIKAEQAGRMTVRGQIRRDIDETIKHCIYYSEFEKVFQSLGYTLERRGKYLRIRPDNSAKWFRMDKLGEGYTEHDIWERLKNNAIYMRATKYVPYQRREKPKGLRALYLHYCYLLGELPKTKPNNREAYVAIKEDIKRARMYSEEAKLLGNNGIDTAEELSNYKDKLSGKLKELAYERAKLRNMLRRMHDTKEMQPIKDEISALSEQMAKLRREIKLCDDIALRSGAIEKLVYTVDKPDKENYQEQRKEQNKNREKEERTE